MRTVEYAPDRSADVHDRPGRPVVLIWHGTQTDSRSAVTPLARMVAQHDLAVVAADWNSHADDRGRADLLGSAHYAAGIAGGGIVVVGWSLGAVAAAGLTLDARRLGVTVDHAVCLGGAFFVSDPISGMPLIDLLSRPSEPTPFTLLHGRADDVVPVGMSRECAELLGRHDRPCEVVELDADHGSIAGARYDSAADRYEAATDDATLAVAAEVARRIAAVTGPGSPRDREMS